MGPVATVLALTLCAVPEPATSSQSIIDDVLVGYSLMHISSVRLGGQTRTPIFNRHKITLQLGVGDFTMGAIIQRAEPSASTAAGAADTGVMLTLGYDHPLSDWLLLDAFARIGVTSSEGHQPLYATDTDLRLKVVLFDADGWGPVEHAWFPSAYVGTIVNRFGRVQAIAGAGVWWWGFGVYATGLYAINGVSNPTDPGDDADIAFASVKNASLSIAASYDLDLATRDRLHFEVRRNIPFRNAGNDTVFLVELHHFFD